MASSTAEKRLYDVMNEQLQLSEDFDYDEDLEMFQIQAEQPQASTSAAGLHDISQSNSDSDSVVVDPDQNDIDKLRKEVCEYVASGASSNTLKKIKTSVNKFKKKVNGRGEDKHLTELDMEHLDALLAVFIKGVKKDDAGEYEPMSVQSLSGSVRKYLADNMIGVDVDKSFPISKSALQRKKRTKKPGQRQPSK